MCGIWGLWTSQQYNQDLDSLAKDGISTLTHRGPDDSGTVHLRTGDSNGSLVLGHRRLSIIDLSKAGHQPMIDKQTGNWIVFNGEVYNFKDIREELISLGCTFQSKTDTEVILQSYRVWGKRCIEKWRGMFAVALWDASRQEIFLIRDRLGVKPLYYYYKDGLFIFSSEIRAIIATGLVQRNINLAALNTYLMLGSIQDPLTIIEGINSLPAAHTLTVSNKSIRMEEYWDFSSSPEKENIDYQQISENIKNYLEDSVRLRLISDVPLGLFLSGGIDSSALALLMQKSLHKQVKAFTVGFSYKAFDEASQAAQTAGQLGLEHHTIHLTQEEMVTTVSKAINHLDQPSIDGVNTYQVSSAVKRAGITVALSGIGGDEAFCGYNHFRSIPRMEYYGRHINNIPFILRFALNSFLKIARSDRIEKLRSWLLSDYGFTHPYYLLRTLFLPTHISNLITPEATSAMNFDEWAELVKRNLDRSTKFDDINRVSYLEFKTYIPNTLLRDTDVMSMANSLEVREPFLDHILLEEIMKLPGSFKLKGQFPKSLLIKSLPGSLPINVVEGRKRGFTLPYSEWLPVYFSKEMEETLSNPPSCLAGVFYQQNIRKVWHSFLNGECSWSRPWSMYVLFKVVDKLTKLNTIKGISSTDNIIPEISEISVS
jgi:asparagine synthase (glutamine-hydrolysing)